MLVQVNMYKELSYVHDLQGYQKRIVEVVKYGLEKYTDYTYTDEFDNIVGYKRCGSQKKIMICTQIDESGFIVDSITNSGFIKVFKIGEFDINNMILDEVIIHGKEELLGILISRPFRLVNKESRKEIFIDTGLSKDELQPLVSIGDFVSFKIKPFKLKDNLILTKVKNNACGIILLRSIAQKAFNMNLNCEYYYVGASQKEIGCNGAIISAKKIQPDLAIIIDKVLDQSDSIGKGVVFYKGPYINDNYFNLFIDMVRRKDILYKVKVQGGTLDKANQALQISNLGIPTILVGIPIKYKNSNIQTICIEDLKTIEQAILEFLKEISN